MAKKDWMVKESELDDGQIDFLNAMLDKSFIVTGCAGSGKSVLAYLKAKRIVNEQADKSLKVIVFTNTLRDFMSSGEEGIRRNVTNHFRWKYMLSDGKWIPKTTLERADYIIVDEIQDYTYEEIMDFIHCAKKNVFFFGDMAQSIYEGIRYNDIIKHPLPISQIPQLLANNNLNYKKEELCYNYRLPIPVGLFAQYVGVALPPFDESKYKSPENTVPKMIHFDDLDAQVQTVAERIKTLQLKDVAVLVAHNADVAKVSGLLNKYNVSHEIKIDTQMTVDFNSELPKLMTYHSSKGLQFESVFILQVQGPYFPFDNGKWQKALYVAMTRTYKNLFIFYSDDLPAQMSAIPSKLYSTSLIETIEYI